ncbi:MAG: S41 family peptidase [candidate division KSB1 bacterium]|nr:S41 family peptidase [candidate division KSB1 bacterium]
MSLKKQTSTLFLVILAVVTLGAWVSKLVDARSPDYYYEVKKNIAVFGKVYEEISKRYVEEVDPEKFMRAGINGMLNTLDPYTVLVESEDNAEIKIMTSGKYGGLGMKISLRNGWPTVIEPPFSGTPALRAGIREGDQIIEIDGQTTKNLTISQTAARLRGEVGTEVVVKIRREGEEQPLEFRLIRAEIIIKDIVYSGLVKEGIGYIKLSHFSKNAGREIHEAISDLKAKGIKSLILDLRQNPGGLLESAVEVADNFIEKGKLIVSTEGRAEGSVQKYYAKQDPIFGNWPLIILVDTTSASASEIVAGAIQDLDRGLVVGSPTFGKGLVQTIIPISRDAALKMTTAKYFIPSGRLIQKPEVFETGKQTVFMAQQKDQQIESDKTDEEELQEAKLEKKKPVYKTASGRIVYGGGGITPDVEVRLPLLNPYQFELIRKSMLFNFALVYATKHPELPRGFTVDEKMIEAFKSFLKEKNFQYRSPMETQLQELEKTAKDSGYLERVSPHIEALRKIVAEETEKEFYNNLSFIKRSLERELSAKLWGTDAEVEASFDDDPVIIKAVEILSEPGRYSQYLEKRSTQGD